MTSPVTSSTIEQPRLLSFSVLSSKLEAMSRARFIVTCAATALALSVFFFSPKFWLLVQPVPGSFEWDRALTFLHQCRNPFASDIEGAMRWRLLPPLVSHALGLTGTCALVIPLLGLIAFLAYWAAAAERLLADRLQALFLTVLVASTGAVISVTTIHGVNDGWFMLALVALAAGRRWPSLVWPGLLGPWVDERYLLGWAAALFCRWWLAGRPSGFRKQVVIAGAALLPYVVIRLGLTLFVTDRGSSRFLHDALALVPTYLPFAQIGWWMGLRAAWLLVAMAVWDWQTKGGGPALIAGLVTTLAGWIAVTLLATDLSRSVNLLLPLLLCGAVALPRLVRGATRARYWMVGFTLANLLMPFATVIYNKVVMIWALPFEVLRFYRIRL